MKSRTNSWAPKPTANPTIPALARMGAMLILNFPSKISRKITQRKILPIPYMIPVSVLIRFSASLLSMFSVLWALLMASFFIFRVVNRKARSNETNKMTRIAIDGSWMTHHVISFVSISFQNAAVKTAGICWASFVFQNTTIPSIWALSGMFFSMIWFVLLSHQESSRVALLIKKLVLTFGTETTISPEEGR